MSKLVELDETLARIRHALTHMWHTARDATSERPAYDRSDSLSVIDDRMDDVSISLNQLEDLIRNQLIESEAAE